jgi:hypothetical protein
MNTTNDLLGYDGNPRSAERDAAVARFYANEDRMAEVDGILNDFVAAGNPRCEGPRIVSLTAYGTGLFDDEWCCRPARYAAAVAS